MVLYISGRKESEVLIACLYADYLNEADPERRAIIGKMLQRAIKCDSEQGRKKNRHSKRNDGKAK